MDNNMVTDESISWNKGTEINSKKLWSVGGLCMAICQWEWQIIETDC